MNEAVDYLNSLHNACASNENALAEHQLDSPYYAVLQVKRGLTERITEFLRAGCTVILTGHAGDGKTALLFQVLQSLSSAPLPAPIRECGLLSLDTADRKLLYIKDMSELAQKEQDSLLLKALRAPSEGNSAILVSNTGPLLSAFERTRTSVTPSLSSSEMQTRLLDGMDRNDGMSVDLGNTKPRIFNMARVDSIPLVSSLVSRIVSDELWESCTHCGRSGMCPIYGNRNDLVRNRERACSFINAYLRWLSENDRRLTIRQVLAQIAFAITSGLSCRDIVPADSEIVRFTYSFANAFWGYQGTTPVPEADQVHGIREIRALELDSKSLDADYAMFVQGDLTTFDKPIQQLLSAAYDPLRIGRGDSAALRCSFRRFYCLFAHTDEEETNALLRDLFSPVFPQYVRSRITTLSPIDRARLKTTIFRALYRQFVGFLPSPGEKTLYLTVRRPGDSPASVQMLQGQVNWTDFEVKQSPIRGLTDDEQWTEILLEFSGLDPFTVSLPILHYFYSLGEGAIATRLNPSLSHGLDRLRSSLMYHFRYTEPSIRILVRTLASTEVVELVVDGEHLTVS